MFSRTAAFPLAVTMVYTGLMPGPTRATSAIRTGTPPAVVLIHDLPKLFRVRDLAVDEPKIKLMVLFEQAGRIDEVRAPHRIQNIGDRDARSQQLCRSGSDVELRFLAALHDHASHAVKPVQLRLKFVVRQRPELRLGHGIGGEAVTDDGKTGESKPM